MVAAVAAADEHFGGIDVLVNNAGYGYRSAIEEVEDAPVYQNVRATRRPQSRREDRATQVSQSFAATPGPTTSAITTQAEAQDRDHNRHTRGVG